MQKDIKSVLVSEEQLKECVKSIAEKINKDYEGEEVILLIILKGSLVFAADLMRELTMPVKLDFMQASSYGLGTESTGVINIKKDMENNAENKNIIIVEDIIDSGKTLSYLQKILLERKAKSVNICSLLSKPSRRQVEVDAKYIGMEIPDEFVVGYGLDYAEMYRNLPYIGILKSEVYEK